MRPERSSLIIEVDYAIGETVYAVNDPESNRGLVTGIRVSPEGNAYVVNFHGSRSELPYYAFELSRVPYSEFEAG